MIAIIWNSKRQNNNEIPIYRLGQSMKAFVFTVGVLFLGAAFAQQLDQSYNSRQSEVAKRGGDVMPFDLKATTHIFTKTANGGIQRVVVKNLADTSQIKLIRQHLRELRTQFMSGDFSGPSHIHGAGMPGLAELSAAKPGQISIDYRDVKGGAELNYGTRNPELVKALHRWFDTQVSDHGPDAMQDHRHHHSQ